MIWAVVFGFLAFMLAIYLFPLLFKGVPFEPTPWSSARRMLELAEVDPSDIVYDLGCGTGRILVEAVQKFGARSVGIEISPLLYAWSLMRVKLAGIGDLAQVKFGDFFKEDLRKATIVTVFQHSKVNRNLGEKLKRELKAGTKVVSFHWPFPDWQADKTDPHKEVFLYTIEKDESLIPGGQPHRLGWR